MEQTEYLLEPLPGTNQYLITQYGDNGRIVGIGVRSNNYLIETWGNKHNYARQIVEALRDMAEIELYKNHKS